MNQVQLVTTVFGPVPQDQLRWVLTETDEGEVLVVGREWFYNGNDPRFLAAVERLTTPNHHVRRDAWVVVKCGQAATGAQGG